MEFKGRYLISAPPEAVWIALHNPRVLAQAIPGCEAVEKISDTEFKAKAAITIGPVKARFEGKVQLAPHVPNAGFSHALTLKGEGQGGAAGFARAESEVRLAPEGGGTALTYDAKAIVGGRLAQLGQRLIDGAAKSLADEFFARFTALMKPAAPPVEPVAAPLVPATAPASKEGLPPQIWLVGLIAIVLILLTVFSIVL
jgi:carbon monoxide dehydrogenase subunit G